MHITEKTTTVWVG